MRNRLLAGTLLAAGCVFSSAWLAAAPVGLRLAPVEREARLTEDLLAPAGTPLRYAELRPLRVSLHRGASTHGTWTDARDDQGAPVRRWAMSVSTPNALSQDFGFANLFLPHGASLELRAADGRLLAGPYTDSMVAVGRRFQTGLAAGDWATIEIDVPPNLQRHLSFELDHVAPAHRDVLTGFDMLFAKSGSCNVDVRCPQGTPYPDQINSVARYRFLGFLCTGALINNVANDRAPYFLTANHCVNTQAEAAAMVFYWKYENPTCRTPGSGASGTSIPISGNSIEQLDGADLSATLGDSDFTLVRLRAPPPQGANAFLAGWDRRNLAPPSAFTIHHPQGHEKRISFDNEPLQIVDQTVPGIDGNSFLRVIDYELGTTEGGSSGGPLFNPDRRIVGQLAGGAALCSVPDGDDYFGRLFTSFTRGTTAATRLRDWLDPANTGVQTLDGVSLAGCTPPAATLSAPSVAMAGEAVNLTLTLPAGTFRVEWDIDGDGIVDRVKAAATGTQLLQPVYPAESNQSVTVRVIDTAGACTTTLQRSIAIDGPRVVVTPSSVPLQLCGDGDAALEPGERWLVEVSIQNFGAKRLTDGHAVFAPVNAATVRLETPAIALPSLGPGGITLRAPVNFAIPPTATCGTSAAIRYVGALDRTAWSTDQSSTPINLPIGAGGPCNFSGSCPVQITPITPRIGLFANPNRFGNGFGTFITDNPDAAPPVFFSAWFTGTAARIPIWYTAQGALVDNRVDADIRQFRRTGQTPFAVTGSIVGTAQVTYLNATDYLFTFNLGGRTGAERQSLALPDTSVRPDRTGAWIFGPESGSGYVVDDARNGAVAAETVISFIYGTDNEPRWTFGAKAIADPGGIVSDYFEIQCPTCPSLVDFTDTRVNAGTLTPTYSALTTGTLSTNLNSTAPAPLNWVRSNVPIEMISTPRPQ